MVSYLITDTSSGIGLAMTSHLITLPASEVEYIFATATRESTALRTLARASAGRIKFVQLDITNEDSLNVALAKIEHVLGEAGIDVLINNTGKTLVAPKSISRINDGHLSANVMSLHRVTNKFLPLLKRGELKKVVNISTELSSLPCQTCFPDSEYSISKAALNAVTVQYSLAYAAQDFTFLAITPGWVNSDLRGSASEMSIMQIARAVIEKVKDARKEDSGKFLDVFGNIQEC